MGDWGEPEGFSRHDQGHPDQASSLCYRRTKRKALPEKIRVIFFVFLPPCCGFSEIGKILHETTEDGRDG